MKILIIEDEADLRESLRELLEAHGHEVLAAEDGVQGLALAAQSPDFIFCDVSMPNLDGHGVLAEIRQMPGVRDVPFVFTTAQSNRRSVRAGMSLGADDYITKPYGIADILGAIATRTRRQSGLREQIKQLSGRQQSEIHAQWSHELLTPLNAVLGSLDLIEMQGESISPQELKQMIAQIRAGAERQERLARKLIAYFSLEQLSHAAPADGDARCATDLAITAGVDRAARLRKREGDFCVSVAPGEVLGQGEWLTLAIAEVADNAAAFSPAGCPIKVSGAAGDGRYRIVVTDEGPGLKPDQFARIGAFTQFDRQVREQQGLGLGLAIARLAAKLAGGELLVSPGPGGRGLRVEFNLPLAPAT